MGGRGGGLGGLDLVNLFYYESKFKIHKKKYFFFFEMGGVGGEVGGGMAGEGRERRGLQ